MLASPHHMTLTPSEQKTVEWVSRPSWPKATLYCIIVIISCGLLSLGLAIDRCVRLFRMQGFEAQPHDFIRSFSESWIFLLMGSTALMSAIFMWAARRYGLLIRKLGGRHLM